MTDPEPKPCFTCQVKPRRLRKDGTAFHDCVDCHNAYNRAHRRTEKGAEIIRLANARYAKSDKGKAARERARQKAHGAEGGEQEKRSIAARLVRKKEQPDAE